jgi:hypothetical protein
MGANIVVVSYDCRSKGKGVGRRMAFGKWLAGKPDSPIAANRGTSRWLVRQEAI